MTWVRLLVLLFALAHATGLSDAVAVACGDDCEEAEVAAGEGGDGCDEGCPPICAACSCARCPVASATVAVVTAPVPPAPARATFVEAAQMPTSRDVDEILRVPIRRS